MIEENVIKEIAGFCAAFEGFLPQHEAYKLNLEYQSLGVLNLIFEGLMGKSEFSDDEEKLIRNIALYLASMVHDIWAIMPDTQNVGLKQNDAGEVILSTFGAPFTSEASPYIINFTRTLKKILVDDKITVSSTFKKEKKAFENTISLFFLGVACGISPYGVGEWATKAPDDLIENCATAIAQMAISTAETYKKLFPSEKRGTDPELYTVGFIYPATGNEKYNYEKSLTALLKYKNYNNLDDEEFFALARNLAKIYDQRISDTGLICAIAMATTDDFELRLIADSKSLYLNPFDALQIVRQQVASGNFVQVLEDKSVARAKQILEIENGFALTPYIKIPLHYLRHEYLHPLFIALYERNLKLALEELASLEKENKTDVMLYLQKLFLQTCLGQSAEAKEGYKKINYNDLPDGSIEQCLFLEILGIIYFLENNVEIAYAYFTKAFAIGEMPKAEKIMLAENIVNISMSGQRFDEALNFIYKLERDELQNLNIIINHAVACLHLGKLDEFREVLNTLIKIVPLDTRVFALQKVLLTIENSNNV